MVPATRIATFASVRFATFIASILSLDTAHTPVLDGPKHVAVLQLTRPGPTDKVTHHQVLFGTGFGRLCETSRSRSVRRSPRRRYADRPMQQDRIALADAPAAMTTIAEAVA